MVRRGFNEREGVSMKNSLGERVMERIIKNILIKKEVA